jgi:flagellar M-ring protein FliF
VENSELIKPNASASDATTPPNGGIVARLRAQLLALPAARRRGLLAVAGLLLLFAGLAVWYAGRPEWKVLFSGLDAKDVQQVAQQLAGANISYQISKDGGGVEVPAESLDKARLEIAAKGMPQTGRLGFELFDKANWMGSEFDERVNYQRALEGELEQTIATLAVVRSARVHLVLPTQSLFTAETNSAKASVVLRLRRPSVDASEADAIRNLVSGAVENLSPDNVVLVDADGRASLKPHSGSAAEGDAEQLLEDKLTSLLEPLVGRDNVRVTVNLSYEHGSEERTDEIFDPTQVAALSMQRSEQSAAPVNHLSGVPGTASNTPAGSPNGAVQGSATATPTSPPLLQKETPPVYPQASLAGQTIKEESGSYAVTKHTLHQQTEPGGLRRVTAAILINDRGSMEGSGRLRHAVWRPRTADEMHRIEELAQASLGYDPKRGDQVVVENLSFSRNDPAAPPTFLEQALEAIHMQPALLKTIALGACGVLLVLFVLRPIARQLSLSLAGGSAHTTAQPALGETSEPWPEIALTGGAEESPSPAWRRSRSSAQMIFDGVSEHIRREPQQSTRLLESWISTPERAGRD